MLRSDVLGEAVERGGTEDKRCFWFGVLQTFGIYSHATGLPFVSSEDSQVKHKSLEMPKQFMAVDPKSQKPNLFLSTNVIFSGLSECWEMCVYVLVEYSSSLPPGN